ncbi:helix-turn-helix transcriptional regulator [Agromyces agglutinans]|uniref:helix-turn-helix transcriptional regulator n=1 Tax=Agromyces agglutinans TaxID=2662258 RepID=UPI001562B949|nr:LuxR family transcriptional regulator [Agromyces agglutinans]
MIADAGAAPFLGRSDELHRLRALVSAARNGVGGAVLVRGEAGIGKSTLLAELAAESQGVTILALTGFEVESRFAYGALQRLGRPLADQVDELPDRQRQAVLVATGLAEGRAPERALVGLAALTLLARRAQEGPLLVLVDDAQHLDAESLEVLGFVARRLSAESVALVFAARGDEIVSTALAGVAELPLAGLAESDASQLVHSTMNRPLDPGVVAEIVAQTGGNPLALSEMAAVGDPDRLTSTAIAGSPAPIGRRLEAHYLARVSGASPEARRWLLIAAAESAGDLRIIRAAAAALGLPDSASAEVEAVQLVEIREGVRFRHPLVRSAVYNAATDADRREVHGALRRATAAQGMEDFSAWHAAAAAVDADQSVVDELVGLADRAGTRGGLASRARLLARAADLSPTPSARGILLVTAAEAAIGAGAARLALELLHRIDEDAVDVVTRGRLLFVRAMCGLFLADPAVIRIGAALLVEAADAFHDRVPELEQRALLQAYNFAQTTEHEMDRLTLEQLGTRLRSGSRVAEGPRAVALRALSDFILEPYAVAVPQLRAAVAMLEGLDDPALIEFSFIAVSPTVGLWDADLAARLLERTAAVARAAGAIRELDALLWVLSAVELTRADPRRSGAYLEQAAELRRVVGYGEEQVANPAQLAWAGTPTETVEQIGAAVAAAGWGGVSRMATAALAIREVAEGRYQQAYDRLRDLVDLPFLQAGFHQIPEFVEAAARSRHRDEAVEAATRMRAFADASGSPWARGMDERCTALLADDAGAEQHYLASIGSLDLTEMTGERGRARLLYGEWLRRMRRRRDAREQLHRAWELFEQAGAPAFAERARRELEATGETAELTERPEAVLTAQESLVARLAAQGATNPEIGATLFISTNTVDYHLRKVFRKLGLSSRRQLADASERFGSL